MIFDDDEVADLMRLARHVEDEMASVLLKRLIEKLSALERKVDLNYQMQKDR